MLAGYLSIAATFGGPQDDHYRQVPLYCYFHGSLYTIIHMLLWRLSMKFYTVTSNFFYETQILNPCKIPAMQYNNNYHKLFIIIIVNFMFCQVCTLRQPLTFLVTYFLYCFIRRSLSSTYNVHVPGICCHLCIMFSYTITICQWQGCMWFCLHNCVYCSFHGPIADSHST